MAEKIGIQNLSLPELEAYIARAKSLLQPEQPPKDDPGLLAFTRTARERNIQPLPGGDWMLVPDGAVKINSFQEIDNAEAPPAINPESLTGTDIEDAIAVWAKQKEISPTFAYQAFNLVASGSEEPTIEALNKALEELQQGGTK